MFKHILFDSISEIYAAYNQKIYNRIIHPHTDESAIDIDLKNEIHIQLQQMQFILFFVCIIALVDCEMKVLRPADLVDRLGSKIQIALPNFGVIPFGHRLMGYVDMAEPQDGCSALQLAQGSQFILMERGNCSLVSKVMNAERAGYSLAIIGNDNERPLDSDLVMEDDGQGYLVNIPSIIISQRDFFIMRDYVKSLGVVEVSDEKVFTLVKFDVEKKSRVDVTFSLDVSDRDSFRVVDEFSEYYDLLKQEDVGYKIVYQILAGNTIGKDIEYQIDADNCICSRRYCAIDPDGKGVASGRNIVEEVLRQSCIFQNDGKEYFLYMNAFNFKCTYAQAYNLCGNKIINTLKLSADKINNCIEESFKDIYDHSVTKNYTNAYNIILEQQLHQADFAGMVGIPSVAVNSVVYKGQLTGKGIFGEICNSFITPPSVCKSEVDNYQQFQYEGQHYLFWVMLVVSILIAIFIIVLYFLFKKFVLRDSVEVTQVQVNEMVSQYIKFNEGKGQQKQNSF
ncbi:unnamed protein product (macronuclear) [Paramecium tetraurelia]|uniref:PA domain-containing protein n=1 Tax=Paramecium tetraurelia TaxID=5888 RepID=A0BLI2_PARTE|nr:uncharacterized protein GSPATT00030032001 [Paramecium tetraurelia]CAK59399.1 unnamed protein product [Paramecium tetraurelia]|eukprot:XP_001426797.1 hypothetical protein (macronuclear) [Paramecium tetraurelia strain d4-2]